MLFFGDLFGFIYIKVNISALWPPLLPIQSDHVLSLVALRCMMYFKSQQLASQKKRYFKNKLREFRVTLGLGLGLIFVIGWIMGSMIARHFTNIPSTTNEYFESWKLDWQKLEYDETCICVLRVTVIFICLACYWLWQPYLCSLEFWCCP